MYSLTGVDKVYPIVEIQGSKIDKSYKTTIYHELNNTLKSLDIDYSGFNQRAMAIIINEQHLSDITIINIQLIISEEVKRLDNDIVTFALTYQSKEEFVFDKEELEDNLEDALDEILDKFATQYEDDNKKIDAIKLSKNDIALELNYETNYEEAVKRAKKEKKNILFVLGANYCPWCRKFEQRVLLKREVNEAIQKRYIPLILNREEGKFPKEFYKSITPVVHFIDYKTQKSYHSVAGYNNKDDFLYLLSQDK